MKRRLIALCLVTVMLFSLCAPVFAADSVQRYSPLKPATKANAMESGYVYCCAQSNDPVFVKGSTAELSFKRRVATPSSSDKFIIEIYRGDSDDLLNDVDLPLVETRSYSVSQFKSPDYILTSSFKLDSRYPAGNYAVLWGIRNSAGKQYKNDSDWVMDMYVVSSPVAATSISCYLQKGPSTDFIPVGQTLILYPALNPDNATTARNFTVSSSLPGVVSATMDAGYIYLKCLAVGISDITVRCGDLEKTIRVGVGSLNDFTLTPGKTTLCVGTTDQIRTYADADGSPIYYEWNSSDTSVATVKNGVVTAVKPGTATISASCFGQTRSVTYTVNYHQLPADTPVSTRTATCPRQAIGHCSVCGKDNCINVFEPAIFTDTVYNSWYSQHVDYVYDNGLMNGVSENSFAPNKAVTRGMVVTVLYRIAGEPEVSGGSAFPDVPENKYYTKAVIWAQNEGVVNGFNDGTYRPNDNVTREQLATILYRYSQANGEQMAPGASLDSFPDAGKVHNYAKTALSWAIAEGIITGVGSNGKTYLQPANSATRAQFATIISRYLQRGGSEG